MAKDNPQQPNAQKLGAIVQQEAHRMLSEAQLAPNPQLIAAGWERRFIGDARQIKEATELYEQLGFEVLTEPVEADEFDDDCGDCQLLAMLKFQTIYTRKGAKPMPKDPFAVFVEEHNHGLAALEKMEQGADSLRRSGYSAEALRLIREANEFIKTEVKAHNQKEEDALFPVLGPYMPSPSIIDVIVEEHRELWDKEEDLQSLLGSLLGDHEELWAEEDRLEALLNSPNAPDNAGAIAESAYNIIYMLRDHIDKENQILFPSAQSILSQEEVAKVAEKMGL